MNNITRTYIHKNGTAVRNRGGFRPLNEGYTPTARRQGKPANNRTPAGIQIRPPAPKGGSGESRLAGRHRNKQG